MTGKFSTDRRNLLKLAGASPAFAIKGARGKEAQLIAVFVRPEEALTHSAPVTWALGELEKALTAKGAGVGRMSDPAPAHQGVTISLVVAPGMAADSFRLAPAKGKGQPGLTISAADTRGFVYALLELAERVKFGKDLHAALTVADTEEEKPATRTRCISRLFSDAPHDKPWFHDRAFWGRYLDLMITSRFNRFALTLGLAYDFPENVTGDYLHFPYPYLLTVPGYEQVRVDPLPEGERERNWDSLRFIAAETARRGLEFQLGIWTHAYAWTNSPNSEHHILGLNPQNHASYCRDALAMLLKGCPEITGVTMRVHGESGVPEGSYDFWQTLFDAFPTIGRTIEFEMHAKGLDQRTIDMAKKTGMRVKIGPKFSAEHQSLGYHQADIRTFERGTRDVTGTFAVSEGSRRFTRYGYADFYQSGSDVGLVYRMWAGTQKHLLRGDAALAAATARSASFCGADGLEYMEPLTWKGRDGSSQPGSRNAYLDETLEPQEGDFAKFEITYRQWGRTLYNPACKPQAWRRALRGKLGSGADAAQDALAYASRILALMTSAHLPSAANRRLWYEMYVNVGILPGETPYTDTEAPRTFGSCGALDPEMFVSVFEHTDDLLAGRSNYKYSPAEVAHWLDQLTGSAKAALAVAKKRTSDPSVDFRRYEEDIRIQIGMGEFFAAKFRAALFFRIFEQTHDRKAGVAAIAEYGKARTSWGAMAERAKRVYRSDISYGPYYYLRGHWSDRIPKIDSDIAAMKAAVAQPGTGPVQDATKLMAAVMSAPSRPHLALTHKPADVFHPGSDLIVSLDTTSEVAAILRYRHVDQAERWTSIPMSRTKRGFEAAIPASYTASPYPLQYYFELRKGTQHWSHPGFNANLSNTPYYVVFKRV
jgi:hypothetical protein